MRDQGNDRGRDHARRAAQPEERHHRHHRADERAHARGDRRLHRIPGRLESTELLGRVHLEQRFGVAGQLFGKAVRHFLVDALELIEERNLLHLLFRMLGDLLPLALDVGGGDLTL